MKQASWAKLLGRSAATMTRALKPLREKRTPPPGAGDWLMGMVMAAAGPRRYWLFRPPGVKFGERLPLMVMLHGCHQDARSFAMSTRMNAVAARERFMVLYPEQSRLSSGQACWNWFDTRSGRAYSEAAWIMLAVESTCVLYAADRERIAVAGLSAGASMAAVLATRYPQRFKAVAMHSGIAPGTASSAVSAIAAMQGRHASRQRQEVGDPSVAWPPLLAIHGEDDAVVSPDNAGTAAQLWSDTSGAREGTPRRVHRGQRYPMTVTDFRQAKNIIATLVRVERLGHAWSGGVANQRFSDASGPDASRMVWSFAAKQFASR